MKLFLSYASEYRIVAEEVALALRGGGHEVIFDRTWLRPGDDYNTKIRDAFDHIDALVFLIAPEAFQSGSYALTELGFASEKWPHPAKRVLPVMVAPTPLTMIPPYLRAITILEPTGNVAAEVANAFREWNQATSASPDGGVRVTVHVAVFESRPEAPAYFVNVTNLFTDRDVEITHVWFEVTPRVDVVRSDRPLPVRLKPYESWETWQHLTNLSDADRHDAFTLARVRLSTGTIVKSIENTDVPMRGFVPGGTASSFMDNSTICELPNCETSSLIFNGNHTATDTNTGLVWMVPLVGQGWSKGLPQGEAMEFSWVEATSRYGRARNIFADALKCQWREFFNSQYPLNRESYRDYQSGNKSFEFAGFHDWRLPTVEEFWSLSQAGIEGTPFMDYRYQMWTANSTTRSLKGFFYTFDLGGHCAWMFELRRAQYSNGYGDLKIDNAYPIRLVRAGHIYQALS